MISASMALGRIKWRSIGVSHMNCFISGSALTTLHAPAMAIFETMQVAIVGVV